MPAQQQRGEGSAISAGGMCEYSHRLQVLDGGAHHAAMTRPAPSFTRMHTLHGTHPA